MNVMNYDDDVSTNPDGDPSLSDKPEDPFLARVQTGLLYAELPRGENVDTYLRDSLMIFLRYFIRTVLVKYKRKYRIISPILTGKGEDKSRRVIYSTEVYARSPFSVENFYECLKMNPLIIPHGAISQVFLERVIAMMNAKAARA